MTSYIDHYNRHDTPISMPHWSQCFSAVVLLALGPLNSRPCSPYPLIHKHPLHPPFLYKNKPVWVYFPWVCLRCVDGLVASHFYALSFVHLHEYDQLNALVDQSTTKGFVKKKYKRTGMPTHSWWRKITMLRISNAQNVYYKCFYLTQSAPCVQDFSWVTR